MKQRTSQALAAGLIAITAPWATAGAAAASNDREATTDVQAIRDSDDDIIGWQ